MRQSMKERIYELSKEWKLTQKAATTGKAKESPGGGGLEEPEPLASDSDIDIVECHVPEKQNRKGKGRQQSANALRLR